MILRSEHKMNYTVISNIPIRETSLSAEALGVLLYLYSQPDNWRLSHHDLMRRFDIGRDKAYAIIAELLEAGYAVRQGLRAPNGRIIGWEYVISDQPQQSSRARPIAQQSI
jgi:DNA-binding IclR family transcriptional regulator